MLLYVKLVLVCIVHELSLFATVKWLSCCVLSVILKAVQCLYPSMPKLGLAAPAWDASPSGSHLTIVQVLTPVSVKFNAERII